MKNRTNDNSTRIYTFLKHHHLGVVSTCDSIENQPESALIAFVEDERLCVYFQTGMHTRKAQNLKTNPKVSLVIGVELKEMATLQYEGIAEQLHDPKQIQICKQRFIAKDSPTTMEYLERPDTLLFKVTPTWIRYTFYEMKSHGSIVELKDFSA